MNIKEKLKKESSEKYKKFSSALIPDVKNMLGVRLPVLRKLAKEIAKNEGEKFLKTKTEFFEEKMLQGMVIGLLKLNFEEKAALIKDFVPKIDNWSICDSFCTGLKFNKEEKRKFFEFIKPYASSNKEFEIRFFLVSALMHFVEEEYLDEIFSLVNKINQEGYYAQMGAAWLVSICYIEQKEKTLKFLSKNNLKKETQNKALRKISESLRVSKEEKEAIKAYKK